MAFVRLPLPRRRVVQVALAVSLAVVVAVPGLGTVYAYAGDVPRGTAVLGVDIGGMSRAQAQEALEKELALRAESLAAPVPVQLGDDEIEVRPDAVGLAIDVEATVAAAAAGGLRTRLAGLAGERAVPAVVTVDVDRLADALAQTAEEVGESMTMPEVRFDGTTPVPVYPEPGLGLDPQRAALALLQSWPPTDSDGGWVTPPVVPIPLSTIMPVTTATQVDELVAELALPAVAAPVTIEVVDVGQVTLPPEAIAQSLQMAADSYGEIVPAVDEETLRGALGEELAAVETPPVDAHFTLDGGEPHIVAAVSGAAVDFAAIESELLEVLRQSEPRQAIAELTEDSARVSAADLEQLGVEREVSSFTTYFDGGMNSPRTQNIVRIAELVDGTLVEPGQTFSLNEHTGERGYDAGFQDAPVILDGRLQPGVGGGISQFTTTLFNAAYYAGLEDVEHHPHSYWYSRYPAVIEATIFYPELDLKFRNNTDYGVLIETSYTGDSITVRLWSTPVYDEVTTQWGTQRDIVTPQTRYVDPGPTCIDTEGIDGFTQSAWRIFHRDGIEVDREEFSWRYGAQPRVICGEDPEDG